MRHGRLSVAIAAAILGVHIASSAIGSVTESDIMALETAIAFGDAETLIAFLNAHPELLQLQGALGDALRAFDANPSAQTLNGLSDLSSASFRVATAASIDQSGDSIY